MFSAKPSCTNRIGDMYIVAPCIVEDGTGNQWYPNTKHISLDVSERLKKSHRASRFARFRLNQIGRLIIPLDLYSLMKSQMCRVDSVIEHIRAGTRRRPGVTVG